MLSNHVGAGQHVPEPLPPLGDDAGAQGRHGPGAPDLDDGQQRAHQAVAQPDGTAVVAHHPGPGHHAAQAPAPAEELDEQRDDDHPGEEGQGQHRPGQREILLELRARGDGQHQHHDHGQSCPQGIDGVVDESRGDAIGDRRRGDLQGDRLPGDEQLGLDHPLGGCRGCGSHDRLLAWILMLSPRRTAISGNVSMCSWGAATSAGLRPMSSWFSTAPAPVICRGCARPRRIRSSSPSCPPEWPRLAAA